MAAPPARLGVAMITIFTIPKAFRDGAEILQENAIGSWLELRPECEVLVFGDDPGVEDYCRGRRVTHLRQIERNEFGTPLVSAAFSMAQEIAGRDVLAFVNTDIILFDDFVEAARRVAQLQHRFLMVGQRWDLDVDYRLGFSPAWREDLKQRVRERGRLHGHTGIDFFVFRRGTMAPLPPFAVGRVGWDNFVIYRSRKESTPVMDATNACLVVHQNHGRAHRVGGVDNGPEAEISRRLSGDGAQWLDLRDADYELDAGGELRRTPIGRFALRRALVGLSLRTDLQFALRWTRRLAHLTRRAASRIGLAGTRGALLAGAEDPECGRVQPLGSRSLGAAIPALPGIVTGLAIPGPQRPFVSVVIPCRNEERFITACLDSVAATDYPRDQLEVLVVDGVSEDRTREIAEEYRRWHPCVRVLSNPRKITPAALNIGITAARGDVIIRMDAHSEFPTNFISTCVELLARTGADVVGGPIVTRPGADTLIARTIALVTSHPFGVGNSRFRTSTREGHVDTAPFCAYRREVFDRVGLFDERLARNQDNELSSRITERGGRIYFSLALTAYYYNQATMAGLLRQALRTGLWNVRTVTINRAAFRWRHFVPLAFVLALTSLGALALVVSGLAWPVGVMLGLYALLALGSTIHIALNAGVVYLALVPFVFFVYHVSYGAGTLGGILRTWFGGWPAPDKSGSANPDGCRRNSAAM